MSEFKSKKPKSSGSTLDHLGSEVFCHNKLLPGKGFLGLEKHNDEKYHILQKRETIPYRTYHGATFGTQFTQQRHKDIAAGKQGIAFQPFNMVSPLCSNTTL